MGKFLKTYVLAIISQLSDKLNAWYSPVAPAEKCWPLKGIEEILRVGKSHTRAALPQVSVTYYDKQS
jgi:hypothetical protein